MSSSHLFPFHFLSTIGEDNLLPNVIDIISYDEFELENLAKDDILKKGSDIVDENSTFSDKRDERLSLSTVKKYSLI